MRWTGGRSSSWPSLTVNLCERIKEGPLKLTEALSIAIQMAEGLEAAHEKGITHRDIEPDNVMLMASSRGLVKLMDVGLAQLAGHSKFTREGTTLGTVNYMSPEQAEGAPTGHATDVWSLGVVLYEMVAGEKPFRGDFDQAIVYSIMNEPAEPCGLTLGLDSTNLPKPPVRFLPFPAVSQCLDASPEVEVARKGKFPPYRLIRYGTGFSVQLRNQLGQALLFLVLTVPSSAQELANSEAQVDVGTVRALRLEAEGDSTLRIALRRRILNIYDEAIPTSIKQMHLTPNDAVTSSMLPRQSVRVWNSNKSYPKAHR